MSMITVTEIMGIKIEAKDAGLIFGERNEVPQGQMNRYGRLFR